MRRGRGSRDSKGGGKSGAGKAEDTTASQAVVTIAPEDGAESVATSGALKVTAAKGKLTTVKVADAKGNAVEGEIAGRRRELGAASRTSPPPPSTRCTRSPRTPRAVSRPKDTTFTTLTPKNTFIGHYTPEDGSTVGVGMPVSINFTRGITDPEAVEKAIKVTAEPAVESRATGSATTASTSAPRSTGRRAPRSP